MNVAFDQDVFALMLSRYQLSTSMNLVVLGIESSQSKAFIRCIVLVWLNFQSTEEPTTSLIRKEKDQSIKFISLKWLNSRIRRFNSVSFFVFILE